MAVVEQLTWRNLRMSMALQATAVHLGLQPSAATLVRWAEVATGWERRSQRVVRWDAMLQGRAHSNAVLRLLAKQSPALTALIEQPLWRALGCARVTHEDIRRWLPLTMVPRMKAGHLVGVPGTTSPVRLAWLLLWLRVTPPVDPLLRLLLSRALRCELPRLLLTPPWHARRHGLSRLLKACLPPSLADQAPLWYDTEQALDDSVRFWSLLRAWGMGTPLFRDELQWCQFCDVCDRLSPEELRAVFLELSVFDRERDSVFEVYTLRWLYQKLYRLRRAAADPSAPAPE
jgi:hypothetical protein